MRLFIYTIFCAVLFSVACMAEEIPIMGYPGKQPRQASASVRRDILTLSNSVIEARWKVENGHFVLVSFTDRLSRKTVQAQAPFSVELGDGVSVRADQMVVIAGPRIETLEPIPNAAVFSQKLGGKVLRIDLEDRETGLKAVWKGILKDNSSYIRQQVTFTASKPGLKLANVTLIDVQAPGIRAKLSGNVQGSPAMTETMYFGIEHPLSVSSVSDTNDTKITCSYGQNISLDSYKGFTLSSVIGVVPQGQMRRGFLYYLERERAHPYRQYIHYNSWYDLNIDRPDFRMTEAEALESINAIGVELFKKRDVKIDGFVMDDGWDSHERVWDFNSGFPCGFSGIREAARSYGAGIGVWMSPWGGYGDPQKIRLENGIKAGFETNSQGFSMAGKNYSSHFLTTASTMMRTFGVNYFKFDGMGGGPLNAGVQKELAADIEAIFEMVDSLRVINPDIFINATVGTWPSPFWTRYVDSIWRQGNDVGFAGVGNNREKWITYRSKLTYERIVQKGMLYPQSSLMFHGLVMSSHGAPGEMPLDEQSVRHEIRTSFGCGSDLQELYITPKLLIGQMWDDLAESAKWYRSNASVFADIHWIGGNPDALEVYGWAAWTPKKATLTLRNPDAQSHEFTLDVASAFELPPGAPNSYILQTPYKDQRIQSIKVQAGSPQVIIMEPFEVLTFDATPGK